MATAPCCPEGSWPQLMTTSNADLNKEDLPAPKGSLMSVPVEGQSDLPLYVVEPEGGDFRGSILVLPDIYSVRVLVPDVRSGDRSGSICEALSEQGYRVVLAGYFRDEPFDKAIKGPDDGDYVRFNSFGQDGGVGWFQKQTYEKIGPNLKAAVGYLKERDPDSKIGVLGFCFGVWAACKGTAEGDIVVDAAVGCHPTTVLENAVFGRDEEAMMASLKQPTTILWAGNDSDSYTGDGSNRKAIEKTGGKVHEFKDMLHGWVNRGDVADEAVKAGLESAMTIIKDTFASM